MIAKLRKGPTPKNGMPHPCPYPQDPHIIKEPSQEAHQLNRSAGVVPNQRRNDDQRARPHARGRALAELVPPNGVIGVMSPRLASIAGNESGGCEVYRSSKAGLTMMMRSFAARHAGDGKGFVSIVPG